MNPDHLIIGFLVIALMAISFMAGGSLSDKVAS